MGNVLNITIRGLGVLVHVQVLPIAILVKVVGEWPFAGGCGAHEYLARHVVNSVLRGCYVEVQSKGRSTAPALFFDLRPDNISVARAQLHRIQQSHDAIELSPRVPNRQQSAVLWTKGGGSASIQYTFPEQAMAGNW